MLAKLGQRATSLPQMARSSFAPNNSCIMSQAYINRRWLDSQPARKTSEPVKFTTSDAHRNYKASYNFYGDPRDLPESHNLVLATTFISGIFYLFFLRDDIDADGGMALFKPIHETVPQYAIPMLQSAIAENRKLGYDTSKLEKKLSEYMKHPEKYGGEVRKLVEN